MVPLFTTEEVLFNRAEANAQLNNISAAIDDLNMYASTRIRNYNPGVNTITTSRIKSYYGISNTKDATIRTILDFKRAEFVQEGMRWVDMLRYKMPVTHENSEGETLTLAADDPQRVFQIPESASLSGIEPNPR